MNEILLTSEAAGVRRGLSSADRQTLEMELDAFQHDDLKSAIMARHGENRPPLYLIRRGPFLMLWSYVDGPKPRGHNRLLIHRIFTKADETDSRGQ